MVFSVCDSEVSALGIDYVTSLGCFITKKKANQQALCMFYDRLMSSEDDVLMTLDGWRERTAKWQALNNWWNQLGKFSERAVRNMLNLKRLCWCCSIAFRYCLFSVVVAWDLNVVLLLFLFSSALYYSPSFAMSNIFPFGRKPLQRVVWFSNCSDFSFTTRCNCLNILKNHRFADVIEHGKVRQSIRSGSKFELFEAENLPSERLAGKVEREIFPSFEVIHN